MSLESAHADRRSILNAISRSVTRARNLPWSDEPQFVANLVWCLPQDLNEKLGSIFRARNANVSVGGVFVHSKPQVTYNPMPDSSKKAVELGDLLLLMTHIRQNRTVSRTAQLLQVKMGNYNTKRVLDANQHRLYAEWPEFTYVNSGAALNGKIRKITGPHLYNGAKYLFLDRDAPTQSKTSQPGLPTMFCHQRFSEELYDFIFGNAGRSFVHQPPWNCTNWDQVITDLLDVTAKRTSVYMRRASSSRSSARGNMLCFLSGDLSGGLCGLLSDDAGTYDVPDEGPPEIPSQFEESDPDGPGMSIIEFTLDETGEESNS